MFKKTVHVKYVINNKKFVTPILVNISNFEYINI